MSEQSIKTKTWIYVSNGQDGSVYVHTFGSQASAEKYAENVDQRFEGDISSQELEFDLNGKLLTPDPELEEDDEEY